MQPPADRPIGVTLLAGLVAIKGVVSLAMATDVATFHLGRSAHADGPTGVAVVVGLLLLNRAYSLWSLRRGAWLITLALVFIDGATAGWELLQGHASVTVWFSLAVALIVELYLLQPSVRKLFSGRRAGA